MKSKVGSMKLREGLPPILKRTNSNDSQSLSHTPAGSRELAGLRRSLDQAEQIEVLLAEYELRDAKVGAETSTEAHREIRRLTKINIFQDKYDQLQIKANELRSRIGSMRS